MESPIAVRVLCAEDEQHVRAVVSEALRDARFEVLEAGSGDEAIELLDNPDHVDILFTDVRMPGSMDGIDLVTRARRTHPRMPVIVTSGYAPHLTARLKQLSEPTVFIAKPYSFARVIATLHDLAANAKPA
jgi:DNA-binding NtrC family response regulator